MGDKSEPHGTRGIQTQISEPRKTEKQMRQGWDDLSEELKREYGKDYLEKGM